MIAVYDGTPLPADVLIASETNPWVEVDDVPVNWLTVDLPKVECPCEDAGEVFIAGVLGGTDTPQGVQRCDGCDTFDGDLDAALALARLVGGVVRFHTEGASR